MRPVLIVTLDPGIEVGLEFGDRLIDLLAEDDAIELTEHRLVEPLNDAIRLRALGLGARMVDILERQIELVFVVLGVAAIFRAAIGQHAAEPYIPRIIERHDAIVEEVSRGDRRLAVVELGEGDLGVGVDKGLLVDAPDPLHVADVERYPEPRNNPDIRFRTRHAVPSRLSNAPPIGKARLGRPWPRAP